MRVEQGGGEIEHLANHRRVRGALQYGLGATLIASTTASAFTFFGADFIASSMFDDPRVTPLVRYVAFLVPFLIVSTLLSSIVRGFKRMDYVAFAGNFVQPLVRLILILVLAIVGIDEVVAMVILVISWVAATLVLTGMIRRLFPHGLVRAPAQREVREISTFAFPFWFSGILTQVRRNVQPVLLGAYSSIANVGIFSIASSANLLSSVAMMATRQSVRPILAETLDEGDHEETKRLYQATTRWAVSSTLPFFLVIIMYPAQLMGLFGSSFEDGAAALVVLALANLSNAATGTCGTVLDMSGLNTVKVLNKVFEFAATIGLNVFLIPRFGLMGAAYAALGSTAAIQIVRVVEVWVIVGVHPYDLRLFKPVAAAAVAYGAGMLVNVGVPAAQSLVHFIVNAATVGLVYAAATLGLGLSEDDRMIGRAVLRRLRIPIPRFLR